RGFEKRERLCGDRRREREDRYRYDPLDDLWNEDERQQSKAGMSCQPPTFRDGREHGFVPHGGRLTHENEAHADEGGRHQQYQRATDEQRPSQPRDDEKGKRRQVDDVEQPPATDPKQRRGEREHDDRNQNTTDERVERRPAQAMKD